MTGGTGVDTFAITGNFAGTLNGGDGNDTFTIASSITGRLNGGAGDDSFNLNALGLAIADLSGGGGNDTLRGTNELASWNISGSDSGTLTTTSNSVNFSGIKNLTGGSAADTFTLGEAGFVSGTIDGGTGTNTLTGRTTGNQSWTISTGNSDPHQSLYKYRNTQQWRR